MNLGDKNIQVRKTISLNFDQDEFEQILETIVDAAVEKALKVNKEIKEIEETCQLLTRQQVADIFGISLVSLRHWEKNGDIPPAMRFGSRVYWLREDILKIIQSKRK